MLVSNCLFKKTWKAEEIYALCYKRELSITKVNTFYLKRVYRNLSLKCRQKTLLSCIPGQNIFTPVACGEKFENDQVSLHFPVAWELMDV